MISKPETKPHRPFFSPGPTAKWPGWTLEGLATPTIGRSHRATPSVSLISDVYAKMRRLLGVPQTHHIALIPASDTGAFECAMWNWLGPRGVDLLAFDAFGRNWASDAVHELALTDLNLFRAAPGELPPLEDCETGRRDLVFTWNGTTTGVRIPDGGFIEARREGVTLCDATSAAFAQPLPWDKLDVTTFSFQKVLGGEAGVGVMVLSDHAIAVLEGAPPSRPMPKIFRLLDDEAKFSLPLLHGSPINTISMLTIADFNTALDWALSLGGFDALRARADSNARLVYDWLDSHKGLRPLCTHGPSRSNTAVCFAFRDLADRAQGLALVKAITSLLAEEEAAFDIAGYRDEPPGLRLWTGATVDKKDLEAVLPWIDWAYGKAQE